MSKKEVTVGGIRNALEQEYKALVHASQNDGKLTSRIKSKERAAQMRALIDKIFN